MKTTIKHGVLIWTIQEDYAESDADSDIEDCLNGWMEDGWQLTHVNFSGTTLIHHLQRKSRNGKNIKIQ